MRRFAWAARPQGNPPTYDARVVDYLRAIDRRPHRPLEPADTDWLSRLQREGPHR